MSRKSEQISSSVYRIYFVSTEILEYGYVNCNIIYKNDCLLLIVLLVKDGAFIILFFSGRFSVPF
jgi:hypothetical protein